MFKPFETPLKSTQHITCKWNARPLLAGLRNYILICNCDYSLNNYFTSRHYVTITIILLFTLPSMIRTHNKKNPWSEPFGHAVNWKWTGYAFNRRLFAPFYDIHPKRTLFPFLAITIIILLNWKLNYYMPIARSLLPPDPTCPSRNVYGRYKIPIGQM